MKFRMPTRFAIEALTVVIALQLIITPCKLLAQSETSDIDAMNRRLKQAEVDTAEAGARKAELDAAKLRSDIAKQDIETRRAQIEALKTTSTVEGALVENSIAASKALGCAAWNMADQIKNEGDIKPGTLVLFSQEALRGLSDFTALSLQLDSANTDYPAADKAVRDKLEVIRQEELAKLIELEKKLEAEIKLFETTKTFKSGFEFFTHGFKSTNVASISSMKSTATDPAISTIADFSSLAGGPASIITTAALTGLAMFKTDIGLKGTDTEPGNQELTGYLFRLLSFELNGQKVGSDARMTLVNPDDIALSDSHTYTSKLLAKLKELSQNYVTGKSTMAAVADKRKQVIATARIANNEEGLKAETKLREARLTMATDALAANMSNPALQEAFRKASADLKLYTTKLEIAQKAIDKAGADFDERMSLVVRRLVALNDFSEGLIKHLSGSAEKDGVPQKSLGDHLRSEIVYNTFHDDDGKPKEKVWWLEADVSANGSNQLKKSSPVIDVFTGGARISYSGGSVVSYQVRNSKGDIKLAGTVWSFAPYRKSSNIMKFECQGYRDDKEPRNWKNP